MKAKSWSEWLRLTASNRQQAQLMDITVTSRWFIWVMVFFVASLIVWSCLAMMDETVTGYGRVIPSSRVQEVQSLDGGTLKSVHVREGEFVHAGDLLLQIDETRYQSSFRVNESELESLQGSVARLESELSALAGLQNGLRSMDDQGGINFPEHYQQHFPEQALQQKALMNERMAALNSQITIFEQQVIQKQHELNELKEKVKTLTRSLQLANEELSLKKPLTDDGVITRVEIINLERRANELQGDLTNAQLMVARLESALKEAVGRRNDLVIRYRADLQKELQDTRDRSGKLLEGQAGLEDRVRKAALHAPVDGLVKTVKVHTEGSVIQPGSTVVEIVPAEDPLIFEARVQPADIAFLQSGQMALVKLTAYEFATFGSLKGIVDTISADTLDDEKGLPYYRVRIVLSGNNSSMLLIPGMTGVTDIVTGNRSVLEYFISPLLRGF
ncbi:HlyD family type I secretion periplasmic adaptor subunit [Thalassotalea sp. G20_0]|uniref:HlyD family type I secretion periplasmic adaptor subunit n=1 Tax=Thalassotalea sp. G20_0 TaxID=2821093 RepID=UPI001ADAD2E6|nr:HlyD family type I secretion periplasmic adaptor subunit [Thalassotalea sp. G20_0]MBO9494458.1 HlyD family type I secretion periplasmic adaptor subunit [Thalassotalea sp. G20_0]